MSFFSQASLVMIPSGYKASKVYSAVPTDGAGDLSFTRTADTATRVGPDGLIEKVRTNLSLNSQTGASWTASGSTVDSTTTADPLGGTAAVQFTALGGGASNVFADNTISITSGTPYAGSVYVKNVDANYVQLTFATATFGNGQYRNFDLTNGTLGGGIGLLGSTIEDVGGGWYRISIAATATASAATGALVVVIAPSASASRLQAATAGQTLIAFGIQFEAGDIATDYIATTSAAVSVGPVANVPRLDYLNSSCPRLLLEPQATALNTKSEDINGWQNAGGTSSANTTETLDPSGYYGADIMNESCVQYFSTSLSSATYTFSCFAKAKTGTDFLLRIDTPTTITATFNLSTGAISGVSAGITPQIQNYGNGWWRCAITFTQPIVNYVLQTMPTSKCYVWGANLVQSGILTSYVPTLDTAVTRGADATYKASISTLIGQTEGVAFIDFVWNGLTGVGSYPRVIELWGDSNNYIQLFTVSGITDIYWDLYVGGAVQASGNAAMALGRNKIAVAYKTNDFAVYKNGTLIASDTSCTVPATSSLGVAGSYAGSGAQLAASVNQALLFKTRLTNDSLASLTSL